MFADLLQPIDAYNSSDRRKVAPGGLELLLEVLCIVWNSQISAGVCWLKVIRKAFTHSTLS